MVEGFGTVINNPRKGWPTIDDFQHTRVFLDNDLITQIEDLIQENKICLIKGAEGRGKTVLARTVGLNKYTGKWGVYFIDAKEIRCDNISNECSAIENLGKNKKTLFIIENAHSPSYELTQKLIESATTVHQKASFIFTSRKILLDEADFLVENPFEELEEKGWYVDLNPGLEAIRGIIEQFVFINNMNYSITHEDELWIEHEFGKEAANLRRLIWYLEAWKEKGGVLSSIERREVLKKIVRDLINPLDPDLQQMLLKVSAVFQFDLNFYGEHFDGGILTNLAGKGVIRFLPGYYYRLQHSSDAAYIIEAEATLRANKNADTITTNTLKEYLQTKPENYFELMKALFENRKKNVLSNIFRDQEIYKVIFDMIKQDSIRIVGSVIGYLTWACGKERGLEFWSRYKKLGGNSLNDQKEKLKAKIDEAFLSEVDFLLLSLNRVDVNEKDWLANEILDENVLVQKAKRASLSSIVNLLRLLPDEKSSTISSKLDPNIVAEKTKDESSLNTISNLIRLLPVEIASAVISGLDPNVIAEKAKSSTAQRIMWTLKECSRDTSNINFANSFLLAVNKEGELIEKLKNSDLSIVLEFLRITKRVNLDLFKELKSSLSPYWLQICLSSGLNTVARQLGALHLYGSRWPFGDPEESARSIVENLASIELSEPIGELYNHNTKPLKVLGKLLDYAHRIAFETDKDAIEKLALQIVNNIDFKKQEKYNLEELSLLVRNVNKCSELAWSQLCRRISSELNLLDYVSIPFDKGLAVLIWHIHQYDEKKCQKLTDKIFSLDSNKLLDSSETKAVRLLIWNLLQINDLKVKKWIQNIEDGKFVSKASASSNNEALMLLWSLYHTDKEKTKRITRSFANNMLTGVTRLEAKDIPLLGFFLFYDIQFDLNMSPPSPYKIAEDISEDLSLTRVAFCIFYLEKKNDKLVKEFLKEFGKRLCLRNIDFSIEEKIENIPFENTRQLFIEIFKDFDIPKEGDSTFVEMIRYTKTYLEKKKKNKVAFGQLQDFLLNNPTSNPIFKYKDECRNWINKAIEYGIYHIEQVSHYKNPSWTVNLLSLNTDNKLVSCTIEGCSHSRMVEKID